MKNIAFKQHESLQGRVRCQVVDSKTGKVKRDYGWQKNLILNQGLDSVVGVTYWNDLFRYCVAGTGTTDTQIDSGVTTVSQTGTTVTLSGGSFVFTNTATDAGRYIKWDTNEEARIVTVTSPTQAEVHVSQSVSAAEFTYYLTNQTGMAVESKRTSTCLAGAGNTEVNRTNIATGIRVVRRTFDFSPEAAPVTYNEVGLSWSNLVAANLFSRIKLVSGIPLVLGDVFRVVYELSFTLTPYAPTATSVTISGWGTLNGTLMKGNDGHSSLNVDGSSSGGITRNQDEPSSTPYCFLSTANHAQPATLQDGIYNFTANVGATWAVKTVSLVGYVSLTFTRNKTVTFLPAEGNLTNITDIGVCNTNSGSQTVGTWFKLTVPQTKDNVHTLVINFTYTWGRVL